MISFACMDVDGDVLFECALCVWENMIRQKIGEP